MANFPGSEYLALSSSPCSISNPKGSCVFREADGVVGNAAVGGVGGYGAGVAGDRDGLEKGQKRGVTTVAVAGGGGGGGVAADAGVAVLRIVAGVTDNSAIGVAVAGVATVALVGVVLNAAGKDKFDPPTPPSHVVLAG